MHPPDMIRGRYYPYHCQYRYHPYPAGGYGYYYDYDVPHMVVDKNNNVYERNPYPFDGPYLDRRMRLGSEEVGFRRRYPYCDSRYCFHGRVDPYASSTAYYHTPLLPCPQPPPPPRPHPFSFPEMICSIM